MVMFLKKIFSTGGNLSSTACPVVIQWMATKMNHSELSMMTMVVATMMMTNMMIIRIVRKKMMLDDGDDVDDNNDEPG